MTVVDASYHLESRIGPHLDWPMFWVFDSAGHATPTPAEVTGHLVERTHALSSIRRAPRRVMWSLDYPHWVADDTPLTDHIEHHLGADDSGMPWPDLLTAVGELTATALPARRAWRLHVFHDVREVPAATGPCTVVVLNTSHSLMAGPALPVISSTLFGDAGVSVTIPGLPPAAPRWNAAIRTVAAVLSIPGAVARWGSQLRSTPAHAPEPLQLRPRTRFNRAPGHSRTIRCLTVPYSAVHRPGTTVTTSVLTAISEAMRRYLEESDGSCPADVTAGVTVALNDLPDDLGVNRLGTVNVMLSPSIADFGERAGAIQEELTAGRKALDGPAQAARLRISNAMPAVVYPTAAGRIRKLREERHASGHALAHTVLTSIDCRTVEDASLCGRELAWCGMTPPLPRDLGLVHGVVGTATTVTLTVHSTPESVPDPDRYLHLLSETFTRLAAEPDPVC